MESHDEIESVDMSFGPESKTNDDLNSSDEQSANNPTIHNLRTETFLPYITQTGDMELLNLVSNSPKYESTVREIFRKRYANSYFVVDNETVHHQNMYDKLFGLFGDIITAVKINSLLHIGDNHWLVQLLNRNRPKIKKLFFKNCSFKNVDDFLSHHLNVTHLTFQGGSTGCNYRIHLPTYCNLKSLELVDFSYISKQSLQQILLHNPQIERLILTFFDQQFTLSNMMTLICIRLKHLKDLHLLDKYMFAFDLSSIRHRTFMCALKPIDSFGMTHRSCINTRLLESIHSDYKSIKHLDLSDYHGHFNKGIVDAIGSFDKIESISVLHYLHQDQFEAIIENLPNLRLLSLLHIVHRTNDQILSITEKCKNLEKLVINSERSSVYDSADESNYRKNVQFHDELIKIIPSPQFRLELMENDQVIGLITKEQIVWRNKLLHWIGYDPIHSQSKLRLLDLATVSEGAAGKHKQPLNLIFNYLDLDSLCSFSMASKECKQFVHGYIYQRCKKSSKKHPKQRSLDREKFVLTDEFGINYNALRIFGKNIRYLEVNLFDYLTQGLLNEIKTHCKLLTKLCFRTRHRIDPHNFILPQVRHFIFYGYGMSKEYLFHCDLSELSAKCPNLEFFEMRTVAKLYTGCYKKEKISFKNLQKIKFKPFDESQVKFAREIFKNSDTEIVIDY